VTRRKKGEDGGTRLISDTGKGAEKEERAAKGFEAFRVVIDEHGHPA
jgi:hypothetical protein